MEEGEDDGTDAEAEAAAAANDDDGDDDEEEAERPWIRLRSVEGQGACTQASCWSCAEERELIMIHESGPLGLLWG